MPHLPVWLLLNWPVIAASLLASAWAVRARRPAGALLGAVLGLGLAW